MRVRDSPGNDFFVVGYDRFLQRYRVGALVQDTATGRFVFDATTNLYAERYAKHPRENWLPAGRIAEYVELVRPA